MKEKVLFQKILVLASDFAQERGEPKNLGEIWFCDSSDAGAIIKRAALVDYDGFDELTEKNLVNGNSHIYVEIVKLANITILSLRGDSSIGNSEPNISLTWRTTPTKLEEFGVSDPRRRLGDDPGHRPISTSNCDSGRARCLATPQDKDLGGGFTLVRGGRKASQDIWSPATQVRLGCGLP